jgi:hypothetical protein
MILPSRHVWLETRTTLMFTLNHGDAADFDVAVMRLRGKYYNLSTSDRKILAGFAKMEFHIQRGPLPLTTCLGI